MNNPRVSSSLTAICILYLVFFGLLIHMKSYSQETEAPQVKSTVQLWVDATFNKAIDSTWRLGGDAGIRSATNNTDWWQFYIRPNINYKLNSVYNFTFGLGTFNTFSRNDFNTYEFRIFQDAHIKWPQFGLFNFTHRIRLEQRFFSYSDALNNNFTWRGRYLIGVRTDPFSMGGAKNWTVFMSLEPFFPLGTRAGELRANTFRWDTALSLQIQPNLRAELHFIVQSSDLFSLSSLDVLDNLFRIRLFKSF